jgi:hypothetical protein
MLIYLMTTFGIGGSTVCINQHLAAGFHLYILYPKYKNKSSTSLHLVALFFYLLSWKIWSACSTHKCPQLIIERGLTICYSKVDEHDLPESSRTTGIIIIAIGSIYRSAGLLTCCRTRAVDGEEILTHIRVNYAIWRRCQYNPVQDAVLPAVERWWRPQLNWYWLRSCCSPLDRRPHTNVTMSTTTQLQEPH